MPRVTGLRSGTTGQTNYHFYMNRIELLNKWTLALRSLQHEHQLSSRFYEKLSWRLGIPAVVFSAIAGATIFSPGAGADVTKVPFIAGICTLFAAIASAAQTFLECAPRSISHKIASGKFGELVAQSELASVRQMNDAIFDELLADIRSKWNIAHGEAPSLRASIIKEINSRLSVP